MTNTQIHRGYIEGYYGRLLSFEERHQLLSTLHDLSMDSYLYAPKEDAFHRFDWRRPYPKDWCANFASFCGVAQSKHIRILAGIAPGLDFAFHNNEDDKAKLRAKAEQREAVQMVLCWRLMISARLVCFQAGRHQRGRGSCTPSLMAAS